MQKRIFQLVVLPILFGIITIAPIAQPTITSFTPTSVAVGSLNDGTTILQGLPGDNLGIDKAWAFTFVASANANLSDLTTTAGATNPTFAAATTAYTCVSNATTSVTVTPTVADATATVEVRVNSGTYATVISGSASAALSLNVGANPIDVKVTAEDGTTTKLYTITVTVLAEPLIYVGQSTIFTIESGTMSVGTNIINNGNISGLGSITLASTAPLTISGTGSISNLILDNPTGVSITSGTTSLTGTLTSTAGALATGGFLTLKSTSITNTARIAPVSGSITGNVTVERYIPAGKRSFRFLTPSVTTASSIKANWQEGATSASSNPTAGYGTHITGTTVDQTNGFDATSTGSASMYLFNNATQVWSSISNTNVNTLSSGAAYRLLVRGDRTTDLTTQPSTNTATTLRATGAVTTGTVTLGTASSTPAAMPTLAANASEFSFIANPYVSSIDWNALSKTGLTGYYYIWDPNLATRGAYVSCFTDGTRSNGSSALTTAIQSGQAFFVQNTSGVSSRQLVITEANKTIGNTDVFRTQAGTSSLSVQLYLTANVNTGTSQDGATALFNSNFDNAVNDDDAGKFTNQDENLAIQRGNSLMSIERRNVPVNPNDTMYLKMWQITQNNYTFKLDASNFDAGLTAVLVDNYLVTETPISLSGTTNINFTTTAIAASKATNRFSIVFKSTNALPTTFVKLIAQQKNAGIEVTFNTANEINMASYEVEESADGTTFTKGTTVIAKNTTSNTYSWLDASINNGNNYYRVKAIEKSGTIKYSNVVKVKIGGKQAEFTVYPNPIKGGLVSLQMTNVEQGQYSIKIVNKLGQEIASRTITHNGGSATQSIELGKGIAQGTYSIQISNGLTTVLSKSIIVE